MLLNIVLGAIIGRAAGPRPPAHAVGPHGCSPRRRRRLLLEYTSELHAGRRWLPFYYQDEDISAYVPQILYFIDGEQRFDSVHAALAFAKENPHDSNPVRPSSTGDVRQGRGADQPGRRLERRRSRHAVEPGDALRQVGPTRRLVRDDGAEGKQGPRVRPRSDRADDGTDGARARRSGATGSRSGGQQFSFPEVADLYRAQVPGYVDRLTDDEQQREAGLRADTAVGQGRHLARARGRRVPRSWAPFDSVTQVGAVVLPAPDIATTRIRCM